MNDTMTEETTTPPKRVRPPRNKPATVNESLTVETIPAPPDADAKSLEMMDWIFTYLPNEMARNFYGGRTHTPRS